ncbi:MAG: hypothetical protein ACK48H_13570 [Microcystis sp.]|nr:hypothetical protein [Microcystis aeruginosa]
MTITNFIGTFGRNCYRFLSYQLPVISYQLSDVSFQFTDYC